MSISGRHVLILYDFTRRRFALEVLGKNGCHVEGVLHLPGNPPVKLDSQDLLQNGDKEFYFLLPVRSILGGPVGPRDYVGSSAVVPHYGYCGAESGRMAGPVSVASGAWKKGRGREYYEEEEEGVGGKKHRRDGDFDGYGSGSGGKSGLAGAFC